MITLLGLVLIGAGVAFVWFAPALRDAQLRSPNIPDWQRTLLKWPSYVLTWRIVGAGWAAAGLYLTLFGNPGA